jgi:hypothetical protein
MQQMDRDNLRKWVDVLCELQVMSHSQVTSWEGVEGGILEEGEGVRGCCQ